MSYTGYNFTGIKTALCLKRITKNNSYFCNKVCPDNYVLSSISRLSILNRIFRFERAKINYSLVRKNKNYLVIVLESPHKDEFGTGKDKKGIGPAFGPTGKKLENNFALLLRQIRKYLKANTYYEVVLINSVQFQVSLGETLDDPGLKDYNWIKIWLSRCNDFYNRALSFVSSKNEVIFINLCTKSANKQNAVNDTLMRVKNKSKKITVLEGRHPLIKGFFRSIH